MTYSLGGGSIQQDNGQSAPWEISFTQSDGAILVLSAQNMGSDGSVHVTITVDGVVFKDAESDGGYVIASASGTIGE